jgi:NADH-quinone oxidoreductase subunit E
MTDTTGIETEMHVLNAEQRREAEAIVAKYPNAHSAMLPLLFLVQSVEGWVTEAGMRDVAAILGVTPAHVLASASFYTMFKKRPQGDYLVSVCRNISCSHMGSRKVIAAVEERLGVGPGETTSDGKFSLEAAECLATCDGAPSLQINYEDFYKVSPEQAVALIDELAAGREVRSVRGEVVKTSKEISRETATAGIRGQAVPQTHQSTMGGESFKPRDPGPGTRPNPHDPEKQDKPTDPSASTTQDADAGKDVGPHGQGGASGG